MKEHIINMPVTRAFGSMLLPFFLPLQITIVLRYFGGVYFSIFS